MAITFLMAFHIAVCTVSVLWKTYAVGMICKSIFTSLARCNHFWYIWVGGLACCNSNVHIHVPFGTLPSTVSSLSLSYTHLAPDVGAVDPLKSVADISYALQWIIVMFCGISSWILDLKKKGTSSLLIVGMFWVASATALYGFCGRPVAMEYALVWSGEVLESWLLHVW